MTTTGSKVPGHAAPNTILRLVAIVALTVITALASCTSGPTDPAPDPVDAFLERMRGDELSARAVVDGTMTVGDAEFALSGSMTVAGDDSQTEIHTSVPAGDLSNERIEVDGTSFLRQNGGPWFEEVSSPGDAGGNEDVPAFVRSVSSVTNQGAESHDGSSLYRLVPAERLDAAALGFGQEFEGATADVAFLVSRDGTLRVMELVVDGAVAAQPLRMEIDIRFEYPAGIEVEAPEDVWIRYRSERQGYSIGHPDGWEVIGRPTSDTLGPPAGPEAVGVYENHLPPDLTFREAARTLLRIAEQTVGAELADVRPIASEGGQGVLASARGWDGNGAPVHFQVAIVGEGRALYELYWSSPTGSEASDRALFEQMVRSFRLED
jgi:hypothetical protein